MTVRPARSKSSSAPSAPVQTPFTLDATSVLVSVGWLGWFEVVRRWMQQLIVIEDTHANRIDPAQYAPGKYSLYKVFHETDRNVFYRVQLVAGLNAWVYQGGTMTGLLADRPADLGPNDAGFLFTASDAYSYLWNGTVWSTNTATVTTIHTLTADATIDSPGPPADGSFWILRIEQDATGGWGVTWGADVLGGPTIDATVNSAPLTMCVLMFAGIGGKWSLFGTLGVPIT
jgi:hypothetical protein